MRSHAWLLWSIISADLFYKTVLCERVSDYANSFTFAKVSNIDDYIMQTFGQTIRSIKTASTLAIIIALIMTALVTLLFMKMLMIKDQYSIALMKALGFTNAAIRMQYLVRSVFILILGVLIGSILANTLGEVLSGRVISSFGASSFQFIINPLSSYLIFPLIMMCSVLIATVLSTSSVGQIKLSENIKE